MREQAVIEAARELVRADESEAMAARQGDPTWLRSAREARALAFAKLKEAVAAYDASSAAPQRPAKAQ
jgi:hypothetical protein